MRATREERFWNKVYKAEDTHWYWTGYTTDTGYGRFSIKTGSPIAAHRFAYRAAKGVIGDGLEIDHLCKVRNCVRPDHLEAVTHFENLRRSGLAAKSHCIRGHAYVHRKAGSGRGCDVCHHDDVVAMRKPNPISGSKYSKLCINGHERTRENSYFKKDGGRSCRICVKISAKLKRDLRREGKA